jgi:RHS repeat-associated protein
VQSILHKIVSGGTQINKADYVYNTVGNRTSLTDRRGAQNFGYDTLDRLTSTTHPLTLDQAFSYDPVGNRTTNGSLYNVGNQLTEDANFTYTYDLNGNLTKKTFKSTDNHIDYTYDAENRLVKVEEFAFGASTPFATSSYRYDGLGRRIEKIGNGMTRRYIYDGEDILLEYDGSNVLQARYTHGPGIDEPLAMSRGGSSYFYHQDGLGTVTELTDSTGATAQSYAYDAWGNQIETTGTVENPYTYTGREFDAETGLYYYRERSYDPRLGRFLQKDPVGFAGGVNLYVYVFNNPTRHIDPLGLVATCVFGQGSGRIICTCNGQTIVDINTYSGRGPGRNNPFYEGVKDIGPIPQGVWKVGGFTKTPNLTRALPLSPQKGNDVFLTERDPNSFFIHGPKQGEDRNAPPEKQKSSKGCPIVELGLREKIGDCEDPKLLIVVP